MKALVVVDALLVQTPDGKVWSSSIYNYDFFKRYLFVFDEIKIAARITKKNGNENYPNLCSGKNIEFFSTSNFSGPVDFFKKYFLIRKEIKECFFDCSVGIFRIPSILGFLYLDLFKKSKKPYAVEVVVDPWDFAAPKMLYTPLRPFIRLYWTLKLKITCRKANGVSYVTKYALQKRYPCRKQLNEYYFTSYYSSVNIPENYFYCRNDYNIDGELNIAHVSNVIGNYVKGHKELIEAVSILKKRGLIINVNFVGSGDYVSIFKKMAVDLGIDNQINFIGRLSSSNQIRDFLIKNDIFVFPSHAEGLPRVLIEAMATGMPCISTNINGIPELLDDRFLVKVGNSKELADKIEFLKNNPSLMKDAGKTNFSKAKEYSEDVLQRRRNEFYKKLKNIVEKS